MFPNKDKSDVIGEIKISLTQINSNISSISHKVGNLSQSTQNLTEVVYTGKDSLVNQLSLLQDKTTRVESIIQMVNQIEDRVTKCETQLQLIESKSNSNTKLLAILFSIILTYMIPNILDKVIHKQSQINIKQEVDK